MKHDHIYVISKKTPNIDDDGIDTPDIENICAVGTHDEAVNKVSELLSKDLEKDVSPLPEQCVYDTIRNMLIKSTRDDCTVSIRYKDKYLTISSDADGAGYYMTNRSYVSYEIAMIPFIEQ